MLDQALDAAQALGQREILAALEDAPRAVQSPLTKTDTMPPQPFIWRAASACCGWLGSPG